MGKADKKLSREELLSKIKSNKKEITKKQIPTNDESSGNMFNPQIHEDDNILVQIVKSEINKQGGISLRDLLLEGKFSSNMEMNNYKGGLRKNHKMAIERFIGWMQVLEIKWTIVYGKEYKEFKKWKKEQRNKK